MISKLLAKAMLALVAIGTWSNASANSVGFDQEEYTTFTGQITVSILYDFTEFAMFGGGFDVLYDTNALEFVSYTQAELPADAQASPVGSLTDEGAYTGAGLGTFGFFTGITSAGTIGTFVFNVIGFDTGDTPCGVALCLQVNAINPFVSLAGEDVSDQIIDNGFGDAGLVPIPLPAAIWLMLSGLGLLAGAGRKTAR